MERIIEWSIGIIAAVLVGIVAIWTRFSFVKRGEIFDKSSGQPIYQTRHDCVTAQAKCNAAICRKIDSLESENARRFEELKLEIVKADAKREAAKAQYVDELKSIHEFIGTVSEYMRTHNGR